MTRYQKRKRELLRRLKSDEVCFDCGKEYPYYVMQFDHVESKSFEIFDLKHARLETLLIELAKCDLVCANCHAIRTYSRLQGSSLQQSPVKREAAVTRREAKARSLMAEIASPNALNGVTGKSRRGGRTREHDLILKEFLSG